MISSEARNTIGKIEEGCKSVFDGIELIELTCAERVLSAFQQEGVASRHFSGTTGYGYDDIGRDTLDRVYAKAMQAESALVRPQFINGTHAIFTAVAGLTEPGDLILAATGKPYDTLEEAFGIRGTAPNSLKRMGILYDQVDLNPDGSIDIDMVTQKVEKLHPRIVYFQRSRGYAWRPSFHPEKDLKPVFDAVKKANASSIIVVDNCYGEFTTENEPTYYGADIIVDSLMKNPGGGIAPTGGYVAGREEYVEAIAQRFTVPGIGREAGAFPGDYRPFYQGLFVSPHVVAQAMKSAVLFGGLFTRLGYDTIPAVDAVRSDIIQSVKFRDRSKMVSFCQAIQAASPIESNVVPEPWDMPGYADQVIMAAGTFVQGATMELSADGPVKDPYIAYMQGALTYSHAKIAAMYVYDYLAKDE